MPELGKNATFRISKGTRTSEGKVVRKSSIDLDVKKAFNLAHEAFVNEYGRVPNYDMGVRFLGGTTTRDVIFEIVEDDG